MTDMEHEDGSGSGIEVAVIGMAGRFPGADTLGEFWEMIAAGREGITTFSDDELRAAGTPETLLRDPTFVRRLGVLRDVEGFDAAFFGYSPREAEVLEPAHRLFLEVAWEALENAGADPTRGSRAAGVYAGVGEAGYTHANILSRPELVDVFRFPTVRLFVAHVLRGQGTGDSGQQDGAVDGSAPAHAAGPAAEPKPEGAQRGEDRGAARRAAAARRR